MTVKVFHNYKQHNKNKKITAIEKQFLNQILY